MGLSIITNKDKNGNEVPTKVFRKDRQGKNGVYATYCIGLSGKQINGDYKNYYLDCGFLKGVDLCNKAEILIRDSFLTVSTWSNQTRPKLIITDFELVSEGEGSVENGDISGLPIMDFTSDSLDAEIPFN